MAQQVDSERIEQAILATLQQEEIGSEASLSLVIVDDEEMTRLHEAYRGEATTTDVLAFDYETEGGPEEMVGYLGDVIVCYDQAARQGAAEGHSVQDELELLTVHGTLHLLGYDDETPEEKERMWQAQRAVMQQLGLGQVAPGED